MNAAQLDLLKSSLRNVPDFPKPGIIFKDITPLLADPGLFNLCLDALEETMVGSGITKIVALDARGFIFGGALAARMGLGFIPVRKKGKLPFTTESVTYDLEYGSNEVEIHADAILPGEKVWIIDDVLATGGTAAAAVELVNRLGGTLAGMSFLIELSFLNGRRFLPPLESIHGILVY
jgi:adenine phosphoribosyltransferase